MRIVPTKNEIDRVDKWMSMGPGEQIVAELEERAAFAGRITINGMMITDPRMTKKAMIGYLVMLSKGEIK